MSSSESGSGYSEHSNSLRSLFDTGVLIAERYRVVRFIASGGMGLVFEVEDEEIGQRLALKALKPDMARVETSLERFRREIRLARRIRHPNVCRLFEAGQHHLPKGRAIWFLTMEHLPGKTLSEFLTEQGPLSTERAEPIVRQLVSGLGAAHRAGVAHRDFKPSNVILVPEGDALRAVITDFGLARTLIADEQTLSETLTQTGQLMGTPAYFAPELLEGERLQSTGDFYALGVVVYEMLTGELPFTGRTPLVMALKRLREPAIPLRRHLPEIPATWDLLVTRCLQRYPKERFAKAEELLALFDGEDGSRPSTTEIVDTLLRQDRPLGQDDGSGSSPNRGSLAETSRRNTWMPWLWGTLLGVAAILLLWPQLRSLPEAPVTVAILPPAIESPPQEGAAPWEPVVGLRLSLTLQRIGHRLPGVRILEAPLGEEWRDASKTPELLLRLAVDEVIVSRIVAHEDGWTANLSRRNRDGEIWQRSSSVVAHPEQWNHALADSLWQAYGSPPRRPGLGPRFEIDAAALRRLSEVARAAEVADGVEQWQRLVDEAQALCRREPQFLEAHLVAVDTCLQLAHRQAVSALPASPCLETARSALKAARLVAPGDLRAFSLELKLALLTEDVKGIEEAVESLRDISPGDPQVALGEATVAWRQGRQGRALSVLRRAVERQPTWDLMAALAKFEHGFGDTTSAVNRCRDLERRAAGTALLTARWQVLEAEMAALGGGGP